MAGYLVPPTKNPGDVLTSALWNQSVRDNLDFGMVRPIADTILGGAAASIDFTSIPATFAHLFAVIYNRDDAAVTVQALSYRFNNDTAANYDYQVLSASAAVVSAAETFAATSVAAGANVAASAGAGLFAYNTIWIPNYAATTGNKVCETHYSYKTGTASGNMGRTTAAGFWRSSVAINRLTILPATGNFVAGSRATLYGMGGV